MSLITVHLSLVKPTGIDDVAAPASGRVIFTPISHGVFQNALRTKEKLTAQILDGSMTPLELTPGAWEVDIVPNASPAWPTQKFILEEGMPEPVNLADLMPVVTVDGMQLAKGDTPTWEDLPGKPTSFPSTIPEVDGLEARLDALKTTEWQECTGVTTLTAGTIWWRWFNGMPILQFRDAQWTKDLVIPWADLAPAPAIGDVWTRHAADISQGNNLPNVSRVAMWNGGLYFAADSPGPMRGNFPYST